MVLGPPSALPTVTSWPRTASRRRPRAWRPVGMSSGKILVLSDSSLLSPLLELVTVEEERRI